MANNLKISMIATIDPTLSKDEINKKIKEIEGKFGKINLQIKLDDSVIKKLDTLMIKLKDYGKASAEASELAEKNNKKQAKSVQDLINGYKELNKQTKYNAEGKVKSTTTTYGDAKGNGRVINTNAKGEVTSYKDVENIQKFQKETAKLEAKLNELTKTGRYTSTELSKIGKDIHAATTIKQLEQIKNTMNNMKFGTSLVADQEKLRNALKKVYDQGVITEERFKKFNTMINSAKNIAEIEKIQKAMNRSAETGKNKNLQQNMLSQAQSLLGSGSKKLDTAGVQSLITNLQAIKPNAANATRELNKLQAQLKNYQNGARVATQHTKSFGDMLGQAFTKFPIWMLATSAFYAPIAGLKQLVSTLYLLDERLISIKKVLDTADMTTVFENATKSAYEYGRTIDGALQSLGEISKLGFEQADAEALNKNSMLLSTVGEFKDDAEAANYLVAIMRQYKFTVAETTDVVSSLNEVSNKTGANTLGLAQALSKSSSTAANAGVSFNDLNGMVSSTIETLKIGGNEAGNFYKTLFTRFLRGSTQSDIVAAGVQVRDLNGELRSATDVLADLGKKWSGYSSDQKNALAQALGGVYHINKVSSLLEHQADVYKNAEFSANSYGSAQKELSTFQEGLAFKTNNMKASFQELAMAIGQNGARGALVGLIESTTSLVQGFTTLTETTNGWNIKLPLLAAGIYGGVKAFTALRLAITGVKASFGVFGIALVAIETLASVFMKSTNAGTLHSEALTETAKKTSETSTEIQRLVGIYNELEPASKNSADKQKELQGVLGDIQKLAPQLIDSTGKYGDQLTLNKGKTDQYIESLKKMTDEQVNQAKIANSIEVSTVNVDLEGAKKKLKELESATKTSFDTIQSYQKKHNVLAVDDAEKELAKRKKELADEIVKQQNAGNTDASSKLTNKLNEAQSEFNIYKNIIETQTGAIQEYGDQLDKVNELEGKKTGIEERQKALDSLTGTTKDNTASNLKQSESLGLVNKGSYEAADGIDSVGGASEDASNTIEGFGESAGKTAISLEELIKAEMTKATVEEQMVGATQSLIDRTKEQITSYQLLAGTESLSAEQKGALADATKYLNELYPQFVENGKLNVEQMRKEVEAQDILLKAVNMVADGTATAQEVMTTNQALQARNRLKIMSAELTALESLMETYENAAQHQLEMAQSLSESGFGGDDQALLQAQKFYNAQQNTSVSVANTKKKLDALIPSYDSLTQSLAESTNYQGQYYRATEKSKDKSKDSIYVTDEYKMALEDLNAQIAILESKQSAYAKDSKKYRDSLAEEIKLLNQKKDLMEAQANSLEKQIKTGKIKQTGTVKVSSQNNGSSGGKVSGKGTKAQIWNFFKSQGFSDAAIAGIMGNIQQESGFSTSITNSIGAFGLVQWLGGRKKGLQNYAKKKGTKSTDLQTQLEYILKEMQNGEIKNLGSFKNLSSAEQAALIFEQQFERSGGSALGSRKKYSKQIYNEYAGSGINATSTTTSSTTTGDKAQDIDEAKTDLSSIETDIASVEEQIREIEIAIVQSKIDEVTNKAENSLASYDQDIQKSETAMSRYREGSKHWNEELDKQINLIKKKNSVTAEEITSLQKLLKTEKLTKEQKASLTSQIKELRNAQLEYISTILESQVNAKIAETQKIYDDQISALQKKLDLMDEEEKKQDRINRKKEIQDQLDKAKSDTRFEYVDKNGNVQLTYDKAEVARLEKEKSDQEAEWKKEDERASIEKQIADAEIKRDAAIENLNKLQEEYMFQASKDTADLKKIMENFTKALDKTFKTGTVSVKKHHSGGIVGQGKQSSKLSSLVSDLFNLKPNEEIVKALKGEVMIPAHNIPNGLSNIQSMLKGVGGGNQAVIYNYNMSNFTIQADNAQELFKNLDMHIRMNKS